MRVVIAGSSGLIGTALRRSFERDGHTVQRLVRRPTRAPDEVRWDPAAEPTGAIVDGADVVVNLAGAGIGEERWTPEYRRMILESRTTTARAVAVAATLAERPPTKLICASGIRYYGNDRGAEILTEASPSSGHGFLCQVTHAWEAASDPASAAGIPVCHLRLGLVLTRRGGVLPRLLPYFSHGLGASFGSGEQYWSHVSLADTVRAVRFLADRPAASGPYNVTSPSPVTNRQFTAALAAALGRPSVLRVPAAALRLALGGVAVDALGSLRVLPTRLLDAGFRHRHGDLPAVLGDALA